MESIKRGAAMKKYEAWEMLNGGCWEQDACSEPIEA